MGKSASGKTSMRSIIFANYLARDTFRLGPTLSVENSNIRFLGNVVLNLWDCGGQDTFMENYFESQKDSIFRHVEMLIYVFDMENTDRGERRKELENFEKSVAALSYHSKNALLVCLVHKMDVIHQNERQAAFLERCKEIEAISSAYKFHPRCFATSIWDETLYKAWSTIVYCLVPNVRELEAIVQKFCQLTHADEIVVFEKATFLVLASVQSRVHNDVHRYEKISNIIKQFKLSCAKNGSALERLEIKNANTVALIDRLTTTTYIMIICTRGEDGSSTTAGNASPHALATSPINSTTVAHDHQATLRNKCSAALQWNLRVARPIFEKFIQLKFN